MNFLSKLFESKEAKAERLAQEEEANARRLEYERYSKSLLYLSVVFANLTPGFLAKKGPKLRADLEKMAKCGHPDIERRARDFLNQLSRNMW